MAEEDNTKTFTIDDVVQLVHGPKTNTHEIAPIDMDPVVTLINMGHNMYGARLNYELAKIRLQEAKDSYELTESQVTAIDTGIDKHRAIFEYQRMLLKDHGTQVFQNYYGGMY